MFPLRPHLSRQVSIKYLRIYIMSKALRYMETLRVFFMKSSQRTEMENLEFQCVCIILLVSVCVNLCVCVQFSGFCLCEVNHSVPGRKPGGPHPQTTLNSGWLTLFTGVQVRWSLYILASCAFSQTNLPSLFFPDTRFWQAPPLFKHERPVPRKGVKEGGKEEEEGVS